MYRYAVFGRLRNLKSGAAPHPFRGGAPILKVPRGGWGRVAFRHSSSLHAGKGIVSRVGHKEKEKMKGWT